jgi:hypothetical protein
LAEHGPNPKADEKSKAEVGGDSDNKDNQNSQKFFGEKKML